jgi:hypothetical protein
MPSFTQHNNSYEEFPILSIKQQTTEQFKHSKLPYLNNKSFEKRIRKKIDYSKKMRTTFRGLNNDYRDPMCLYELFCDKKKCLYRHSYETSQEWKIRVFPGEYRLPYTNNQIKALAFMYT